MNFDELQQLITLESLGAMESVERIRLRETLDADPVARAELARFLDTAASLSACAPRMTPSTKVREGILAAIQDRPQHRPTDKRDADRPAADGFRFVFAETPWTPGVIPQTRFKVLSGGTRQDYVMLLIELGPGVRFPEHDHLGPEELMVLSGDLQTEGRNLGSGDFLHAEPGSHHHDLHTVGGCTALLVISQAAAAALIPASA